jgi:hypothetical protein
MGKIALRYEQFDIRARLRNELNSYVEVPLASIRHQRGPLVQFCGHKNSDRAQRVEGAWASGKRSNVKMDGIQRITITTNTERSRFGLPLWATWLPKIRSLMYGRDLSIRTCSKVHKLLLVSLAYK